MEVYRLSIPNHDGPTMLIERDYSDLREALLDFLAELCPAGRDVPPEIPEDGIALMYVISSTAGNLTVAEFERALRADPSRLAPVMAALWRAKQGHRCANCGQPIELSPGGGEPY